MNPNTLLRASIASLAFASGVAQAAVVSLSNITATWFDATPASNVTYFDNGTTAPYARWGDNGGPTTNSGYDFVVAAQPINFTVPPSPSPNQVIGTFTHQNFAISAGTSITDIKLRITALVSIDAASQGTLSFEYGFDQWETDNGANPCADGGARGAGVNVNGCADRVIANWLSTSDSFVVDDDTYTLNVIGFSLDAGGAQPFTSFWTAEGLRNDAYLVANVAVRTDIPPPNGAPEPGTLALLGLGLAGLAATRRRRQ